MVDQTGYMGLGSNLGNRLGFLLDALDHLAAAAVRVTAVSRLYQTSPMYVTTQPPFLNAVVQVRTHLDPLDTLQRLLDIESRLGRQRGLRFGPRTIDLDILVWGERGEVQIHTPQLTVPHPRLLERAFALVPLAELAGNLVHPICHRSFQSLAEGADRTGIEVVDLPLWPPP